MEQDQGVVGASASPTALSSLRDGAADASPPCGLQSHGAALLALAERCEKAGGPDRELDVLIRCALPDPWEWEIRPSTVPGKVTARYENGSHGTFLAIRYTASLDAAMTLKPEGHGWAMGSADPATWANIFPYDDDETAFATEGAWPALALTAACLRARAASAMSAFGQDPKGLEAKPASAAPEGGDAQ